MGHKRRDFSSEPAKKIQAEPPAVPARFQRPLRQQYERTGFEKVQEQAEDVRGVPNRSR